MTDFLPHEWVEIHAGANPDAPAVFFAEDSISYSELDHRATALAQTLIDEGIRAGDVVPLDATLDLKTIVALVAVPRIGAVPAPYGSHRIEPTDASADDAYAVVPTSGSSGHPRGVVLTPENLLAAIGASHVRLRNDANDRWLLVLPLFHVGGLSVVWRSLAAGGSIELQAGFDAAATVRSLKEGSVSMVSLVPTMLYRILENDRGPYRGIKAVLLGGAPASRDLVERGLMAGLPVLQTYGMTETCSQVATVEPGREPQSLGTAGQLLDGFAVSFDDGEILLDGPAVSPGYFGEAPRVGPYRTGDLGHMDTEERLVVTGRIDELILTGGENVRPSTIEAAIESIPTVAHAVVVGIDDQEWGQVVVAVVEAESGAVGEVREMATERLARHEVPKKWVMVEHLPLLPNGKLDRHSARATAVEALKEPPG